MTSETLARIEKKYIVNQKQFNILKEVLDKYMNKDKYGQYTITNLYYDTKDMTLIRNSISKPAYKEKIRLRAYNIPNLDSKVFLEIKKKYNGKGNKRRISLTLEEAYKFLKSKKRPCDSQIARELEYFINYYDLTPVYYVAYDRIAYKGDDDLRITVDTNLRSRKDNLKLEYGDDCKLLYDKEYYILEIKATHPYPRWLIDCLNDNNIYPSSFSKIGNIYLEERKMKYV